VRQGIAQLGSPAKFCADAKLPSATMAMIEFLILAIYSSHNE